MGPTTMNSKIADQHLARQACIYIRQSTMGQVRFHQESTERQYNLKSKAESTGGELTKPTPAALISEENDNCNGIIADPVELYTIYPLCERMSI
jgi:hypothetical protein